MRLLLRSNNGEFNLTKDFVGDDIIPPYAILSHTWSEGEEVTFKDLIEGTGQDKAGYKKIQFCGQQAERDGLQYFWVDTCCIDKSNQVVLQNAINSMFHWYQHAKQCYVYLSDVSIAKRKRSSEYSKLTWEPAFRMSRWFTRGWTLQELLAPRSVKFFSYEGKVLGDKIKLMRQIHEITGIPFLALQGSPLCEFSIEERISWTRSRQTKYKEDKAYSLSGMFDICMPLLYGEGEEKAFRRLRNEITELSNVVHQQQALNREYQEFIQHLRLTDPRDDKKRIEETKGGLLEDSYRWIIENSDFQRWRDNKQSRLLWIKGDPGKGKTMLLCGIINELSKSMPKTDQLSYFFCQATDSRINNATAVLRGLLYLLVSQQPSLVSHIQEKYNHAGKALFDDANAWIALCEIFTNILQDQSLNSTYFTVDALDECDTDLPKLLDFIVQMSSVSSRAKWIVSSRNEAHIEQRLRLDDSGIRLSLELKENAAQVSRAVDAYINCCVLELPEIKHNQRLQDLVREKMQQKANGTFLWVSLVIKELKEAMAWEALQILEEVPTDLKDVYRRMIQQIKRLRRQYPGMCRQVLSTVLATYRPLHLQELHVLSGLPTQVQNVNQATATIVRMCGSFLTIREDSVYIIHQSARDFLSEEARHDLVPRGIGSVHQCIFYRSLQLMSTTLRRDIYSLRTLGYPAEQIEPPDPDPLAALRYPCIYWIDHLCEWNHGSSAEDQVDLQDRGAIDSFLRQRYLYWLEALSLCQSMSKGVASMAKLEVFMQGRANTRTLNELVRDARRFIMSHKWAIEKSPLQAYASAILFSPTQSLISGLFKREEPHFIIKPDMEENWSACLQTLEGHRHEVNSVAFSPDSTRLASGSRDNTVKIWDASSGACLSTLKGHSSHISSVAFSPDSTQLTSGSEDKTVKIWDASSGACLSTLEGHSSHISSVAFSPDSTRLASGSCDNTVKIWDASSGACLSTLKGHSHWVNSVAFSPDSTRLASGSCDNTVKIWDASSGACLLTLEGHSNHINSVAFSPDSTRLASGSKDKTVKIWDASSGACLSTLKGHSHWVSSVAFSPDSTRLASGSCDNTIKIWDPSSSACLSTLEGHSHWVNSVAFSPDSTRLVSGSSNNTVKIWDASSGAYLSTLEGHSSHISSVAFSPDSTRLASGSCDNTVKIWDASSGACLSTLKGHSHWVSSVAFSPDSTRLASVSCNKIIKIWDASSGACLSTLKGHRSYINSVAFSPDSTRLVSVSEDNTVKSWDASSGACLLTLEGHSSYINSVAFSPDSTQLASGSNNNTVYQGIGISSDRMWITYNSENMLWLPLEYRPSRFIVSKSMIGIGTSHGRVWICSVKGDKR
ncbi:HET-R [Bimuria novae-zelandiae CBS 107.79]|uniref:HET-R n=1 Tax=Bimuria novae-zelandiae CBS 107.79 TaxID=1447943 RepID=A0A6A5ULI8_9PLEO|nr:HET-R [Bimuria novae-zelandiae CBS 107.79]